MSELFLQAILAHLIADWLFQNDWMARNKSSLLHPAAYIHGLFHLVLMLVFFDPLVAACIVLTHILIDTRKPLQSWAALFGQTTEGPYAIPVAMVCDQVLHLTILYIAVLVQMRYF